MAGNRESVQKGLIAARAAKAARRAANAETARPKVLELHRKGLDDSDIADEIGCTIKRVRDLLFEMGLRPRASSPGAWRGLKDVGEPLAGQDESAKIADACDLHRADLEREHKTPWPSLPIPEGYAPRVTHAFSDLSAVSISQFCTER
jgi:hypothetical protein